MKVCAPLVPPAVVTVTVRAPSAAAGSITKLAVSDVPVLGGGPRRRAFHRGDRRRPPLTMTLVTVTPPPLTVTVVAPTTKLVPVSVTATVVPGMP